MSLTIITPVFNAAELVAQFTDNILSQTRRPDAVVFVDDGSSDGTVDELRRAALRLEAADVRCKIVTHLRNLGRGAARNSGLEAVDTDYVAWLDIDDLFGEARIARLHNALVTLANRKGPWLLSTPYSLCQARRISVRQAMPARTIANLADLYSAESMSRTLQLQSLAGPVGAFRTAGFDPDLTWAEDFDFILRFLDADGQIFCADSSDSEAPQPDDVIYFQSFSRTGRDDVETANRLVFDKNRAILLRHGVNPDEEFSRKRENYIGRFVNRPDTGTMREKLAPRRPQPFPEPLADGAWSFLSPTDDVVVIAQPDGQPLEWRDIVVAFCRGADRLRHENAEGEVISITDFRILRRSDGLFDLQCDGRMTLARSGGDISSWEEPSNPTGRFQPVFSRLLDPSSPLFISFFSGASIYRESAMRLSRQLESFGLDYQICEFVPDSALDWTRICRKKIAYYIAQHRRHGRPVFWIDVDSQLVGDPRQLGRGDGPEIGAFLRNFSYLTQFDPLNFARLLHPGYLRFGTGEVVDAFFAHMSDVDAAAPESATDDWVLQEALTTFDGFLKFTLFPPSAIVTNIEADRHPGAVFQHTDSGNVAAASKTAAQHTAEAMSPERQVRVLREAASMAMSRGEPRDASVFYKRIRQITPNDADALVRLLDIYDGLGEQGKYAYHFNRAKNDPALRSGALRAELDRLYRAGRLDAAAKIGKTLLKTGSAEDSALVQSRAYRHGFDRDAAARNISDDDRVAMMWWEQPFPGNLGDIIGPYVVGAMTGVPPRYSKSSPRMLSIGSIIRFARTGDTVWGSGAASRLQAINPQADFRAVRGPLTRDLVLKAGGSCPEVYGDPAWFLPLIRPCRDVAKTHRLGLIRHFTHETRPLKIASDVRQIGILRGSIAEIEEFLDEMNSCEAIISTSLHGLIIAQAYGIPAALAVDTASGRQIHGDGMKFTDYALSVGAADPVPIDLASVPRIDAGMAALCTHMPTRPIDLRRLAEAAPFTLSETFRALL